MTNLEKKSNIHAHLRRIIGQLQGLEKMISEKRDCQEVMMQLMAARASLEKLGVLILQDESSYCFVGKKAGKRKMKDLEKVVESLFKVT